MPAKTNQIEIACELCGTRFALLPSRAKRRRFCSQTCANKFSNSRNFTSKETACASCGKSFSAQPHRFGSGRGKFCSRECQFKSMKRRKMIACKQCGNEFEDRQNPTRPQVFCSNKCKNESRRGKNHPLYVDGKPREYGFSWKAQRKLALERDGHKCAICGQGKYRLLRSSLHVHHIIPIRLFDNHEQGNTIDNLITVCASCHRRVESGKIALPRSVSP